MHAWLSLFFGHAHTTPTMVHGSFDVLKFRLTIPWSMIHGATWSRSSSALFPSFSLPWIWTRNINKKNTHTLKNPAWTNWPPDFLFSLSAFALPWLFEMLGCCCWSLNHSSTFLTHTSIYSMHALPPHAPNHAPHAPPPVWGLFLVSGQGLSICLMTTQSCPFS